MGHVGFEDNADIPGMCFRNPPRYKALCCSSLWRTQPCPCKELGGLQRVLVGHIHFFVLPDDRDGWTGCTFPFRPVNDRRFNSV